MEYELYSIKVKPFFKKLKINFKMSLIRLFDDVARTPATFSTMIDQVFNDLSQNHGVARFRPSVDIVETEEAYEVHVSVPGMQKEDFQIDLDKNILRISGKREMRREEEDQKKHFHVIESSYGSFERAFTLPEHAQTEGIQARYEEGVLKVHIPKDEKTGRKRSIEIG